MAPLFASIKDNFKGPMTATQEQEINHDLNTVVESGDYCQRRQAMARVAGMVAGMTLASVNAPAFAAETKEVMMGTDAGQLVFVPANAKVCKGDSVKWIMVKAGPHNVIFDEEAVPEGVDAAGLSMPEPIGEEGESWSQTFNTAGTYEYYCEPHRSTGMQGKLVVS